MRHMESLEFLHCLNTKLITKAGLPCLFPPLDGYHLIAQIVSSHSQIAGFQCRIKTLALLSGDLKFTTSKGHRL